MKKSVLWFYAGGIVFISILILSESRSPANLIAGLAPLVLLLWFGIKIFRTSRKEKSRRDENDKPDFQA
ncbi:MAG: hypothetical protein ACE14T_07520 [Syntrophales bacterium]